mmetsp:Transcript_27911/g.70560  ORF Transcript_27911/g.70560 Transcript_27911/m.70560 type:complete len:241 (+) Transcript_27911:291-1013(+)|eukprot:g8055.t1
MPASSSGNGGNKAAEFADEILQQAVRIRHLQVGAAAPAAATQQLSAADAEELHALLDREEKNAAVIELLKQKLAQQNGEMSKLVAENMAISEHLQDVQQSLEKMKSMASDRGIGKEVGKLVSDSGLNAYLCRKVFRRLYEDALKRVERRRERATKLLAEKEQNLVKTFAGQIEFTDTDCAFLRIRPLVPAAEQTLLTAKGVGSGTSQAGWLGGPKEQTNQNQLVVGAPIRDVTDKRRQLL